MFNRSSAPDTKTNTSQEKLETAAQKKESIDPNKSNKIVTQDLESLYKALAGTIEGRSGQSIVDDFNNENFEHVLSTLSDMYGAQNKTDYSKTWRSRLNSKETKPRLAKALTERLSWLEYVLPRLEKMRAKQVKELTNETVAQKNEREDPEKRRKITKENLSQLVESLKDTPLTGKVLDGIKAFEDKDYKNLYDIILKINNEHSAVWRKEITTKEDNKDNVFKNRVTWLKYVLPRLKGMIEKQEAASQSTSETVAISDASALTSRNLPPAPSIDESKVTSGSPFTSSFIKEFKAQTSIQNEYELLKKHFDIETLTSSEKIEPGAYYFIAQKKGLLLVQISTEHGIGEKTYFTIVLSGQSGASSTAALDKIAKKGNAAKITPKHTSDETSKDPDNSSKTMSNTERDRILAPDAFSHAGQATQQSGLLASAQLEIENVLKLEYQKGDYHKAKQSIQRISNSFLTAKSNWESENRRFEDSVSSGKHDLSLAQINAKRAQINKLVPRIQTVETQFNIVIQGLDRLTKASNSSE